MTDLSGRGAFSGLPHSGFCCPSATCFWECCSRSGKFVPFVDVANLVSVTAFEKRAMEKVIPPSANRSKKKRFPLDFSFTRKVLAFSRQVTAHISVIADFKKSVHMILFSRNF